MEAEHKPERITIRDAAEIVGVSYERMRQLVRAGLFGCRNGRVERASVLEYALERIHRLSKRRPTS